MKPANSTPEKKLQYVISKMKSDSLMACPKIAKSIFMMKRWHIFVGNLRKGTMENDIRDQIKNGGR